MEDLNSEKDSEKDAVLCEIFTSLKALANLRKQYDNATSEGYINLSKARYSLGVTSLSSIKYPKSITHTIGVTSDRISSDEITFSVVLPYEESPNEECEVRQRNQHSQETNSSVKSSVKDPITWFSVLPPSSLRSSQQNFKQSIEIAVALVNMQLKIQQLVIKYKTLCNLIK